MKEEINSYTLGADPELFIINEKTKSVVSSIGLIPGVKGKPWTDPKWAEGYGLETDNILAEFNIPPAEDCGEFTSSINYMKEYIDKFVKAKNPELGILCTASKLVDTDQLQSKEAKLFGCDRDFNVYTMNPNPKPKGTTTNLRSAGFHIHFGYENPDIDTSLMMIKYFDMYLGVPSVIYDEDTQRRKLYGKAGAFRLCPYGFEYRVLSSFMMCDDDCLEFVYDQVDKAVDAYNHRMPLMREDLLIDTINQSKVDSAQKLCKNFHIL